MRKLMLLSGCVLLMASFLAACGGPPQPPETPPAPPSPTADTAPAPATDTPGSPPLTTGPPPAPPTLDPAQFGPVYVDEVDLVQLESFPVQVRLVLRGSLPNPCSEFVSQVEQPDEYGRIVVQAYSRQETGLACIQVLQPMDESIPLGAFTQGTFTVWLNGELVGEFEL